MPADAEQSPESKLAAPATRRNFWTSRPGMVVIAATVVAVAALAGVGATRLTGVSGRDSHGTPSSAGPTSGGPAPDPFRLADPDTGLSVVIPPGWRRSATSSPTQMTVGPYACPDGTTGCVKGFASIAMSSNPDLRATAEGTGDDYNRKYNGNSLRNETVTQQGTLTVARSPAYFVRWHLDLNQNFDGATAIDTEIIAVDTSKASPRLQPVTLLYLSLDDAPDAPPWSAAGDIIASARTTGR